MEVKELVKEYNEWVKWLQCNGVEDGFSELKIRWKEGQTKEEVLDQINGNLEELEYVKKCVEAFENMVQVLIKEGEKEDEAKD